MLGKDGELGSRALGDPVIAGVAIRGVAYGELEIPAERYEAAALLDLLDRYGGEIPATIH